MRGILILVAVVLLLLLVGVMTGFINLTGRGLPEYQFVVNTLPVVIIPPVDANYQTPQGTNLFVQEIDGRKRAGRAGSAHPKGVHTRGHPSPAASAIGRGEQLTASRATATCHPVRGVSCADTVARAKRVR